MPVPESILKPCRICRKLTSNKTGYCDEHEPAYLEKRALWRERHDLRRGSPSKRGYDRRWAEVRKVYLMQHPLCEECQKEGRIKPAKEVHHIKAISEGGDRLASENLMAVCRACHQKFTKEQMLRRRKADDGD